jgi:hypothetical protein
LAAFQTSIIGRFWLSTEVMVTSASLAICVLELAGPERAGATGDAVEADVSAASAGGGRVTIVLDMQPNRPVDIHPRLAMVTGRRRGPTEK